MFFLCIWLCIWFGCAVLAWLASYFLNGECWHKKKDLIATAIMGPWGLFVEIGIWLTDE